MPKTATASTSATVGAATAACVVAGKWVKMIYAIMRNKVPYAV